MKNAIDLNDIQGNIMINYAEHGYFKSRYLFLEIEDADEGRSFVRGLSKFISSATFDQIPDLPGALTNVSFTYNGLQELGLPTLTLRGFPDEFIMGIRNRDEILGDNDASSPDNWDKIFRDEIHIMISIDALDMEALENRYQVIKSLIDKYDDVILLEGFRDNDGENASYQDSSVIYDEKDRPTAKEHFGYTDGISNPYFKGMTPEMGDVMGGGKKINYQDAKLASSWAPIETGEFILGYRDEANEYPAAPIPKLFSKNGSFMVFNKFHENVGKFNEYLDNASDKYGMDKEMIAAKFVGRWRNGAPMATFPTKEEADKISLERQLALLAINEAKTKVEKEQAQLKFKEVNKHFTAFDYSDDIQGSRCPVGAHTRRANPRGSLEMGKQDVFATPAALDNRRRIIRRGLPYGTSTPTSNDGEHGTIIITIVANIKRQFEFVIQQWLDYGNDFRLANDKDPILGSQPAEGGRMVIEGDKDKKIPPKFLMDIPRFIETRGGVYLFMPSISAINMIAEGIVDPT